MERLPENTSAVKADLTVDPQASRGSCPSCATASLRGAQAPNSSFSYSIGNIELAIRDYPWRNKIAQVIGRAETANLTDHQCLRKVLKERQNRYLARHLCWVLTTEGLDTHILIPRDPADYDLLVEALRPSPSPLDIDVAIGFQGPTSTPDMCNGLTLPILIFDVLYSFDRDSFVKAIPRQEKADEKNSPMSRQIVLRAIVQLNDSAGASDRDRALNYLAVRYPMIYETYSKALAANSSMPGIDVVPSSLSGTRKSWTSSSLLRTVRRM